MMLYYCATCGRWQDVSLGQSLGKALLDGFFKNVPEEQRSAMMDANVFECPDGHGALTMVQATDRISVRPSEPVTGPRLRAVRTEETEVQES